LIFGNTTFWIIALQLTLKEKEEQKEQKRDGWTQDNENYTRNEKYIYIYIYMRIIRGPLMLRRECRKLKRVEAYGKDGRPQKVGRRNRRIDKGNLNRCKLCNRL
jgi:hypothetical protein